MTAETVISGKFWVVFWLELAKMLSILFEILTSHHMQDDASGMLWFLLRNSRNWDKKQIFWLILGVFFVYILLHTDLRHKLLPNERSH